LKRFKDIMHKSLSEGEIRALPDEWRAAWIMRPNKEGFESAKTAMQLRAMLIAVAAIYVLFTPAVGEIARMLIAVVGAYEFAYYAARRELCEKAYTLAMIRYMDQAEALDQPESQMGAR
jgi:hypothetical protein